MRTAEVPAKRQCNPQHRTVDQLPAWPVKAVPSGLNAFDRWWAANLVLDTVQ